MFFSSGRHMLGGRTNHPREKAPRASRSLRGDENDTTERGSTSAKVPRKKMASAQAEAMSGYELRVCLRDVVAQRGPEHIVDGSGGESGDSNLVVVARPAELLEIGVLETEAETTLRPVVELVPQAQRTLRDLADVAGAGATARGERGRGRRELSESVRGEPFGLAAAVIGERRAVTADSIGHDLGAGGG